MPRTATNRARIGETLVIDATSAANWTELSGAGVTKTTDTTVLFEGNPTTRVDVPAALATNFEIGVSTTIGNFPTNWLATAQQERLGVLYKASDMTRLTGIAFYVGDSGYTNFANGNADASNAITRAVAQEWTAAFKSTAAWSTTGSPVYTGSRRTKIRFTVTSGEAFSIWIAKYAVAPLIGAGFSLVFDDGYDEHYNFVYPQCLARSIPCSFSIDRALVGRSGYMTEAQLKTIASDSSGLFELVNHGYDNKSATTLGNEEYIRQMNLTRDYLREIGAGNAANFHVLVQGATSRDLRARMLANGYQGAREVGSSDRSWSGYWMSHSQLYCLDLPASCNLEDTQPLATVKGYVDNAVKRGQLFVAMGHFVDPAAAGTTQYTEADVTALLDYVVGLRRQGLISTYKMSDAVRVYARGGRKIA